MTKILEKYLAILYLNYLRENNFSYELQSGFRFGHSTENALIRITNEIVGIAFIDFRKAFDVIDYELLLKKMSIYGASNNCVVSFQSGLEISRQFVKFGAITSEQISVTQRLAEESVHGPVLFLLLVNDMPRLYRNMSNITIYADDTNLSLSSDWSDISTHEPFIVP